jgi:hypothetical protein
VSRVLMENVPFVLSEIHFFTLWRGWKRGSPPSHVSRVFIGFLLVFMT